MSHLKELRIKAGYKTAKEITPLLGITPSAIYQIEGGRKQPSVKLAIKMANLYNCSLENIFRPIHTTNSGKDKMLNTDGDNRGCDKGGIII